MPGLHLVVVSALSGGFRITHHTISILRPTRTRSRTDLPTHVWYTVCVWPDPAASLVMPLRNLLSRQPALRRCCGAQLKSEAHGHTHGPPPIRNHTTAAVGATVVSRLTGCSNLLRPTCGCLSPALPASSSCRTAPNGGPAVTRGPPTRHLPKTRIAQSLMYICVQHYLGRELINDCHLR